jgi:hypothetical protein
MLRALLVCVCLLLPTVAVAIGTSSGSFSSPTGVQTAHAAGSTTLVINEVWDSQNPANEYFELYNLSNATINLYTYVIYNRDGSTPLSNLDSPSIAAGEFRTIGPTQLHTGSIGGPTGLASNDFLALVNTSPSDAVIDVVNWGGPPNPNWPNYDHFHQYFFPNGPQMTSADDVLSLQRWPDGLDTDASTDWAQIQRSPSLPSCADPNEGRTNDDTPERAVSQTSGTSVLHRICPAGEQDYISLTLSNSYTYTIQTTLYQGSQVNTRMQLYNSNGDLVAEDNSTTSNTSTIRYKPSTTGTFKAMVTDASGGGGPGPSWLYYFTYAPENTAGTATPTASTTGNCTDAYEPDDTTAQAKLIQLNTQQVHVLCHPDGTRDTDWVLVEVSAGKVYTFQTSDLATSVDTIISLYNSDGTKLAESDDYNSSLASRIDYSFSAGGVYFLRIRNKTDITGPGYQYTVSFSSTGQLPPSATATATLNPNTPTPTQGPCYDAEEPDGVPETAKLILIGQTQHHSFCPAGDADWARFYARAGKVYTIRTFNLGTGVDTYMWLFDSDGKTVLAYNDDGGTADVSSRLDFYPQRDDYYFVQVKDAGDIGGSDQTYDLALAVAPGAPQPPGTATGGVAKPIGAATTAPSTPTVVVQPTTPPIPSPTQGAVQPTPAAVNATSAPLPPGPAASQQPTVGRPATSAPAAPTSTAQAAPTQQTPNTGGNVATPTTETVVVPGVPNTGEPPDQGSVKVIVLPHNPERSVAPPKVVAPPQQSGGTNLAPMLFRVFYDRNRNNDFDQGEGIRGINVYFLGKDTANVALGMVTTGAAGSGQTMLPKAEQRVYIPYLGINVPLVRFPDREQHFLWLPKVQLPDRVP